MSHANLGHRAVTPASATSSVGHAQLHGLWQRKQRLDSLVACTGKELRLAVHALKLRSGLVLDVEDAASEPEAEVVDNEESADFNPASVPFAPLSGSKKRKSRPPSKGPSSRHTADALRCTGCCKSLSCPVLKPPALCRCAERAPAICMQDSTG